MIPWRKYEETDRSIPSHVPHLVYDKHRGATIAERSKSFFPGKHYDWIGVGSNLLKDVTHWSPINKPGEEEA
ncbi:hypothetical protein MKY95_23260 [Paenibacillus sp. FSL P4-0176]|uniref:hypothetical protein n=1 Tax=Paenibacillus sp. FSL P4-0176 TaxID=2921631 RepID=UPI0030D2857A